MTPERDPDPEPTQEARHPSQLFSIERATQAATFADAAGVHASAARHAAKAAAEKAAEAAAYAAAAAGQATDARAAARAARIHAGLLEPSAIEAVDEEVAHRAVTPRPRQQRGRKRQKT